MTLIQHLQPFPHAERLTRTTQTAAKHSNNIDELNNPPKKKQYHCSVCSPPPVCSLHMFTCFSVSHIHGLSSTETNKSCIALKCGGQMCKLANQGPWFMQPILTQIRTIQNRGHKGNSKNFVETWFEWGLCLRSRLPGSQAPLRSNQSREASWDSDWLDNAGP